MRGPTARQLAAWEAVQRHGGASTPGAQAAAAHELGVHQAAISSALNGYARNMGLDREKLRPPGPPPVPITPRERKLLAHLAAADQRIAALLELAQVSQALLDVCERLDRLEKTVAARPAPVSVNNRRLADGGRHRRDQVRGRPAA